MRLGLVVAALESVVEDMDDMARPWLWKLALPTEELIECVGLFGLATCSTGLDFAPVALDPVLVRICRTSMGWTLLWRLAEEAVRCGVEGVLSIVTIHKERYGFQQYNVCWVWSSMATPPRALGGCRN